MRRSRKKNPIAELVLMGANPALHGNPSWPAARDALRNGGDWPAARRALLQSKRNGGERNAHGDSYIGDYKGYSCYFAGTSYNCPALKLYGYRNDASLYRAIDKKLPKKNASIYEALKQKLGREPSAPELKAEVSRIKEEGFVSAASRGKLPHQRGKRRNGSLEKAEKLYSDFHGKDATEVIEMQESDVSRHTYTALGDLVDLTIETGAGTVVKIDFSTEDAVKVASAPGGRQLYLIGGSQDLDSALGKFDTDAAKDFVELGRAKQITYRARKSFNDFRLIDYYHDLGEESGNVPLAFYDRLRKRIYFAGGSYHVEAPGIID